MRAVFFAILALGATQALGAVVKHTFVVEEWVVDFKRPTASLKKPARLDRLADSGYVIAIAPTLIVAPPLRVTTGPARDALPHPRRKP